MTDKTQKYLKLIDKYLDGMTSIQEESDLLDWKKSSDLNKKIFNERCLEYESNAEKVESNESWEAFRYKYNNSDNKGKTKALTTIYKYAAIILLFVSIGLIVRLMNAPISDSEVFVAEVPMGEKCNLKLPDGSEVKINSDSKLTYQKHGGERIATLEGEAWFSVAKDKKHPFIVKTNEYDIEVLGTVFNVMAYSDYGRTETSLIEGKVKILSERLPNKMYLLNPNQKLTYHHNNKNFNCRKIDKHDLSWKNNEFEFYRMPFDELARRLERWYDVKIKLMNPELKELFYSGKFKNKETIWQVLDIIKISTPITYRMEHRKVFINLKKK